MTDDSAPQDRYEEEVIGLYVESIQPYIEDHWKVVRLASNDFNRLQYGREYELKRTNPSGTQGWVAGNFTRESLTGLRDMLTRVLDGDA